ncbi:MAG: hypothetical protein KUA43_11380, partial [Hoeflea sp.]|uniref:hypothetical protein n=1 Tax=Hoeflea sp. TaxID=1940281 RepID=UPI001D62D9ED
MAMFLRRITRHAGEIAFLGLTLTLVTATGWAVYKNVLASGWDSNSAAWAQASGSVLAIAAAAWIARGDARRNRRWRRDQGEEAAWHARFIIAQAQYDAQITAFELSHNDELVDGDRIRSWRQRALTSSMALQTMLTKVDHIHPFVITTLCNSKVLVDSMEQDLVRFGEAMSRFEVPQAALASDIVGCQQNLRDLLDQYDNRSAGLGLACQTALNIDPLSASNFDPPHFADQHLACPALAGVAEGRPSAGDVVLRL